MKQYIYTLIILFLVISCNDKTESNKEYFTTNEKDISAIDFDRLVDNVTCVLLEKKSNTLFDCWKVVEYKKYIYLYSLSDFAVQIYNKEGLFVKRIPNGGKKGIETPTDILINEGDNELWICDSRNRLMKYSLEGDFIDSIELSHSGIKMVFNDMNTILVYHNLFDENCEYLFHAFDRNWNMKKNFIKKGKMSRTGTAYPASVFAKDEVTNNIYAIIKEKGNIYKYSNGELNLFCKLNFGGDLLTEEKYPEKGFTDKQMSEIINNKSSIYSIKNFQAVSNSIIFRTEGKEYTYYYINCNNGKCVKFDTLFDGFVPNSKTNNIAGSCNDNLLIIISKDELIDYYKDRKSKYKSINDLLLSEEDFDTAIIYIKIKEL